MKIKVIKVKKNILRFKYSFSCGHAYCLLPKGYVFMGVQNFGKFITIDVVLDETMKEWRNKKRA